MVNAPRTRAREFQGDPPRMTKKLGLVKAADDGDTVGPSGRGIAKPNSTCDFVRLG